MSTVMTDAEASQPAVSPCGPGDVARRGPGRCRSAARSRAAAAGCATARPAMAATSASASSPASVERPQLARVDAERKRPVAEVGAVHDACRRGRRSAAGCPARPRTRRRSRPSRGCRGCSPSSGGAPSQASSVLAERFAPRRVGETIDAGREGALGLPAPCAWAATVTPRAWAWPTIACRVESSSTGPASEFRAILMKLAPACELAVDRRGGSGRPMPRARSPPPAPSPPRWGNRRGP